MTEANSIVVGLRVTAVALGVAVAALAIAWWRREPPPPTAALAASHDTDQDAKPAPGPATTSGEMPQAPTQTAPTNRADTAATASTAVLYGTVRSAEGEPVEGYLWLNQGTKNVGSTGLRGGTSAFAFAGLAPGTYRLTSRFDDQLPLARDIEVVAPTTRLDVVLDARWRLMVHAVTPDGAPLTQAASKDLPRLAFGQSLIALALSTPLAGDLPAGVNQNAGIGVFRAAEPFGGKTLPKSAVGVLTLAPDRPVQVALVLGSALVAQQQVAPGTPELTFTVRAEDLVARTATVRLRVVDEAGTPIEGAMVNLGSSYNPKAKTGADGRFVIERVTPGRARLGVRTGTGGGPPLEIDVAAGADLDLGDVTVRAYAKFDIDFDGFGDGGGVYLYLLDGPARPGQRMDDTFVSPQNGRRSTVLLHPGRYAAVARSKDGVVVRTIDTAAVEGQVLRFDCVRGANLHLVSERQLVLPLDVSIEGPGGALVWRRDLSGRVDTNVELPAGDYRATITNEGGAVTHRAVHLGSDGATITLP